MSNSRHHGLQHTRLPCPSLSPRVCSNSCPLSQWCHPTISSSAALFSSCPQSVQHEGLSQWVGSCTRCPKYWSFSISHPDEYLGLISFRIDWFDLLAFPGTLNSLLQHHNWRASALFMVQLPQLYMTPGKTVALTRWTFIRKACLLFNTLSRFVIPFLPRSKCLLISWLQSPSAVTLETLLSLSRFPFFPHLFAITWWEWIAKILVFWTLRWWCSLNFLW